MGQCSTQEQKQNGLLAALAYGFAYRLFRSPFARRSPRVHDRTMKLFRYAADRGNRNALATYGALLYFRGSDEGSRHQGALYLKLAAELGDSKSAFHYAQILEQGLPPVVLQNNRQALDWYTQAAQGKHPLAIKRLIEIYSLGQLGTEIDSERAAHWQQLSSI